MKPGIDIKRTFPAAPQALFDAWTQGDLLAQWFRRWRPRAMRASAAPGS